MTINYLSVTENVKSIPVYNPYMQTLKEEKNYTLFIPDAYLCPSSPPTDTNLLMVLRCPVTLYSREVDKRLKVVGATF